MVEAFALSTRYPTGSPADQWVASDPDAAMSVWFVGFSRERWKEAMDIKVPAGQPIGKMRGVYVLRGRDPLVSTVRLYIGHGDLQRRIESHDKERDFWSDGVAIVEKADEWDMGHTGHLETRLIEAAKEAQRCVLTNKKAESALLKGAARGGTDKVVEKIVARLDALGYHEFRPAQASRSGGSPSASSPRRSAPRAARSANQRASASSANQRTGGSGEEWPSGAELRLERNGIVAYARRVGARRTGRQPLLVLRGSYASGQSSLRCPLRHVDKRREIWGDRAQSSSGQSLQFETDHEFGSPSEAASVILGQSANGKMEWRAKDGTPLGKIKD